MKKPAYLFGPFVGELSWELYRFAPYLIHIKKEHPDISTIVFTRQSSFDLYGKYADILVPLRIPNDSEKIKECFRLNGLLIRDYNKIARSFESTYKKRFQIIEHYFPDLRYWRYRLKWQFPRRLMDYDFKPREKNKQIARRFIKHNNILVDNKTINKIDIPEVINSCDLICNITNQVNDYDSTTLGCIIEAIKISKVVVGNLDSIIPHLAILLGKPLICINTDMTMDSINLLNPLKTPIIFDKDIKNGIKTYENTI
jgi:hypothetical protein